MPLKDCAQSFTLIGSLHQLGPQASGSDHRVPAVSVVHWMGDEHPASAVGVEHLPNERRWSWLVDVEDDDALGVAVHCFRTDAERTRPAQVEPRIEHNPAWLVPDLSRYFVSAVPEDDDDLVDATFVELLDLVPEEGHTAPIEKRFGRTHAAR